MSKKNYAVAMKIKEEYKGRLPWYIRAGLWMQEWYWIDEDDKTQGCLLGAETSRSRDRLRQHRKHAA